MREGLRKSRIMVGLLSIPIFIVASFSFGYAAQKNANDSLLGFSIGDNSVFSNMFSFSQAHAQTDTYYPYGDVVNHVIVIDLKDPSDDAWNIDQSKIDYANSILNNESGSLNAYMNDISYKKINVTSKIFTNTGALNEIEGYVPSKNKSYYLDKSAGADPAALEEELLREIIEQFKVELAGSTTAKLDTNDDGDLDNVTFVIRGKKSSTHNLMWPHQYTFTGTRDNLPTVTTADGELKFKDYNVILSGDDGDNKDDAGIFNAGNSDLGVIAHEYLHVFGFPDLYHNYKYDASAPAPHFVPLTTSEQIGDPLGKWDIMDNTISTSPQLPMVYTNKAYSPWSSEVKGVETIQGTKDGVTLRKVVYDGSDKIAAMLKVDASINPLAEDEYFMIEYRTQSGWDANLPQSGLLVYRVNLAANHKNANSYISEFCDVSNKTHCGNMFGTPDEVFIFRPEATNIASGNVGSNTDIYLSSAALLPTNTRTTLGKTLAEVGDINVANLGSTIYYSDGSNSGIVIDNLVVNADETITFDIDFPQPVVDEVAPTIDDPTGNGINGNWINGSPVISLYVSDVGKGLQSVTVSTTNGEIMSGSEVVKSYTTSFEAGDVRLNTNFEFKANKNGTYKVVAKDHNGNTSVEYEFDVTNIDHVLPEIVVGDATLTSSNVRMKVTFKDEDSKVDTSSAFYTTIGLKDSTSNLSYDQAITAGEILLDVAFQGKVCINVKDVAGNLSKEPSCWVISNDKTKPSAKLSSTQSSDTWTSGSVSIDVKTTDDSDASQTGISTIEVTTVDGFIEHTNEKQLIKSYANAGTTKEDYQFKVKANGTYTVNVCDYSNNCIESTYEVSNIDQVAPVITKINAENVKVMALFATTAHSITFEAHDEPVAKHSGLKEIRYQFVEKDGTYISGITNSVWKSTSVDGVLETPENYEGTIYAYAIDNVGNVSTIAQKDIKRVNEKLPNSTFDSGIVDTTGKVNIIGIDDPDVSVALKDVDVTAVKEKLGEDFLASHSVKEVFDISLLKNGSAYLLTNEVTIRFTVEEALRNDGSLMLMAIDADGTTQEVAITLGESYIEFKTDTLSMFALVSKVAKEEETISTLNDSPKTGDETSSLFNMMFMISMTSIVVTIGKKKYDELNILDK